MDLTMPAGNPRFFACTGPHPLSTVARAAGCDITADDRVIAGLASLDDAGPHHVSFLGNPKLRPALSGTAAGAVLVTQEMAAHVPQGAVALVTPDPVAAWARVAALFHPVAPPRPGIHPAAVVEDGAIIHPSAEICANAVIGAGAEIGPGCRIGPCAVIGEGVVMGADCRIGPNATVSHARLGDRVYIYPGARIGQEGFGFAITAQGFVTVPQLGSVVIGNDVEIGANATIDRGALRDTVIGDGTRLDNLVQVAHNVRIGRCCAIASQVGLAGSSEIGDFVVIGGQAGVADGMKVGNNVRIGAQSGVMSTIEPGSVVVSSPARPVKEVFREIAMVKKLAAK